MAERIKDIAIRALKTFWQAGLAYILLNVNTVVEKLTAFDAEALKELLITLAFGAVAAGLSAVYNGVVKPLIEKYLEWYRARKDDQFVIDLDKWGDE